MGKDFFELVWQAFPQNIQKSEIKGIVSPEIWERNPRLASLYVLRNHPMIDWRAYADRYPDIKKNGLDPCLHFIRSGLYEGRKIQLRHHFGTERQTGGPAITIAIIMGDSLENLDKCIASVTGQTYKNIEFYVVPRNEAQAEQIRQARPSIKMILPSAPNSLHLQRKAAVEAARGRFFLFLSSFDTFEPESCKTLYISAKAHDIVEFNVNSDLSEDTPENEDIARANKIREDIYPGNMLLKRIFTDRNQDMLLMNKFFNMDLVKGVFAQMPTEPLDNDAAFYESLALYFHCRYLKKITTCLLDHKAYYPQTGKLPELSWKPVDEFVNAAGLGRYSKYIQDKLAREDLYNLEKSAPDSAHITASLDILKEKYGITTLLNNLIDYYFKNGKCLANLLQVYTPAPGSGNRKIGIFYNRISIGGIEKVITFMTRLLAASGYEVFLFLEEQSDQDMAVEGVTEIYYVSGTKYEQNALKAHVKSLGEAVEASGIGMMLYQAGLSPALLWDIALLKFLSVPVIVTTHCDLGYFIMSRPLHAFAPADHLEVYKCANKLQCLSRYSEIFYRANGIDAEYIFNPACKAVESVVVPEEKTIVFMARLADPLKRVNETIRIMKEVLKTHPDARLTLVGGFDSREQGDLFNKLIWDSGMGDVITITGWLKDTAPILDKARVLLCTSITEGFPNMLTEAQTRGIPCVIYDLPVMIAENNPGIIKVPDRDYRQAAKEINTLLEDDMLWVRTSEAARKSVQAFSEQDYITKIMHLVETHATESSWTPYSRKDYFDVIKSITRYRDVPAHAGA